MVKWLSVINYKYVTEQQRVSENHRVWNQRNGEICVW